MGIGVINLWDDEEMSQVSETDYAQFEVRRK